MDMERVPSTRKAGAVENWRQAGVREARSGRKKAKTGCIRDIAT